MNAVPHALSRVDRFWHRLNGGLPPHWSDFQAELHDVKDSLLISEVERGSSRLRYNYSGARVDAVTGVDLTGRYLDNTGLPDLFGWVAVVQASYDEARENGKPSNGNYVWPNRSGEHLTIRYGVFPFVEDGEIRRFIGIEDYSSFPSGLDGLVWNERQVAVATRAALDAAGSAVAWTSEDGEIFYLNHAMETVLVSNDGLGLEGRMVKATNVRDAGKIERAIKMSGGGNPCRMLIARRNGGWYRVSFHPAPNETRREFPCARIILVVSDHVDEVNKASAGFAELHGLTKAECGILKALAGGQNPGLIAADTGRSIHTVRTQIRSILQKTGASGQVDLIRLLSFS
jgi:DNA-binding CsgD family transcriptional regulator